VEQVHAGVLHVLLLMTGSRVWRVFPPPEQHVVGNRGRCGQPL